MRSSIVFGLALALVSGCGGAPSRAPAPAPPTASPSPPIVLERGAEQRMNAHVRWLADDARRGRAAGSDEERAVIAWIAERFEEVGLEPAYADGYTQPFEANVGVVVDPARTTAAVGGESLALGTDFVVAEGSASGAVSGRARLVGFGISTPAHGHDDYDGHDVSGAIVVMRAGAPEGQDALAGFADVRTKLHVARERGAAGAIVIDADDDLTGPTDSADMGLPAIVITATRGAALLARPRADRTSRARVGFEVAVSPDRRTAHNVAGVLRARGELAGQVVVVGAHHDHLGMGGPGSLAPGVSEIHNGADDNASGVALVIEIARALVARRDELLRTVVFVAFGAEELGVLGSRHWVRNRPDGLEDVVAMVNADMVGRLRDGKLTLLGAGTSPTWGPLAARAADGLDLELATSADGFGPSDQTSFYAADIPVLMLWTGVHEHYHRPTDDVEHVDAAGMVRVTTFGARVAHALATAVDRPAFVRTGSPHGTTGRANGGFRVSLGTIPDYAAEVQGVALSGVRPGSPAEIGGIRAGDVIVAVAGTEVRNIYDYVAALRALSPGTEIEVVVEREGRRREVSVVPAPR